MEENVFNKKDIPTLSVTNMTFFLLLMRTLFDIEYSYLIPHDQRLVLLRVKIVEYVGCNVLCECG